MLGAPPVWSSAVMIPKNIFDELGNFKEGETIGEDVEMWCRIALRYSVAFNKKICSIYYQDAENRLYVKGKNIKKADGYIETLENALNNGNINDNVKTNIKCLIETIYVGYAISINFC